MYIVMIKSKKNKRSKGQNRGKFEFSPNCQNALAADVENLSLSVSQSLHLSAFPYRHPAMVLSDKTATTLVFPPLYIAAIAFSSFSSLCSFLFRIAWKGCAHEEASRRFLSVFRVRRTSAGIGVMRNKNTKAVSAIRLASQALTAANARQSIN